VQAASRTPLTLHRLDEFLMPAAAYKTRFWSSHNLLLKWNTQTYCPG
jgi:hypothetical protein